MNRPPHPRRGNPGWFVALAFMFLGAGCVSTNPQKFPEQVRQWVPLGTSAKQAECIMTQKGFTCYTWTRNSTFNPYHMDYLGCEREQVMLHDWSVKFFLEDGKVVRYGPITIDDTTVGR